MLNRRRRLHQSSREKLSLVSKSASWFLVSTYLIWILGSKLILSNNLSNATQWVLDACLIIGLRPLMIILITAPLSSKTQSCASHWEEVAFVETWSRFDNCSTFWLPFFFNLTLDMRTQFPAASLNPVLFPEACWVDDFFWFDECNTSITISHKSRAGMPSIRKPASNEIIPDSVELWDTDVCFLHIQLMGTNVRLPKTHKIHLMLILNLQGCQQSLSLEIDPIYNVELYYPHDNIVDSYLCEPSVCHKLLSILWLLESLFKEKRMSGLPIRAKYKHFKTVWEHTSDKSPTASNSSFLKLWSSKQGVETLYNCSVFFHLPVHNISRRTLEHVLPCRRTTRPFSREVSHILVGFSVAVAEISDSNISQFWSIIFSFALHSRWVHARYRWSVKEWCWFCKINKFHQLFHMGAIFYSSSSHFDVIHVRQEQSLFPMYKQTFPIRYFFPSKSQWNLLIRCSFPQKAASGCPHKLRTRGVFHVWPRFLATCDVEDVPICLGTLTLELSATLERPPLLLGCKLILRRRLLLHSLVISQ